MPRRKGRAEARTPAHFSEHDEGLLDLFFKQSLDGFFFMMLDEPVRWDSTIDKNAVLDYVFSHQRVTEANDAMLLQYGATREEYLGQTPAVFFAHDIDYGKSVWRDFFDAGHLHIETDERKLDGTRMWIEGDYVCLYDKQGRITGHFGIQRDVTEQKRALTALLEEGERLRLAASAGSVGLWDWNLITNQVYFSNEWKRLIGYGEDEIGNEFSEWQSRVHPEDLERSLQTIRSFIANPWPDYRLEFRFRHKDGSYRNILTQAAVQFAEDGSPARMLGSHLDITKDRLAEEALKRSEAQLLLIHDNISDPVFTISVEPNDTYRFMSVNRRFLEVTGLSENQVVGRIVEDVIPEPAHALVLGKYKEAIQNEQAAHWEEVSTYPTGRRVGEVSVVPVFDMSGNCTQLVGVVHDMTARKRSEEALKEAEERYRQMYQLSPDAILIHDMDMNILNANDKAIEAFGYSKEELLGMNVFELHPETEREHSSQVLAGMKSSDVLRVETAFVRKDGSVFLAEATPCKYKLGSEPIIHVVIRDVTERQRLEDVMHRAQKLESLGVLAGGIAHDFNNILGGVFGNIEMALEQTSEKQVSTYLIESMTNIDRARALTQQLLTFSQGGAPVLAVRNLFPFVQETVQFALSGSAISSRFQIQENLWPCHCDKNQIGQVVDNLSINAQQAMPNGGTIDVSATNISLSAREHGSLAAGNYVKLSIRDQGIGIPREFLPRIFDPYYTTKSKGQGLGLASCYSIVTQHDGAIEVESEPGKGSTFHVYLPASAESVSTLSVTVPTSHTGSGTFLVMDDEEAIRKIMKKMLESFGYAVVLKENGQDALDFFTATIMTNRKLAGVIVDLTIPGGLGGGDVIQEIRKLDLNTPVFVASGYSDAPIMAAPEKYGFNASIRKPFMKADLSKMLEEHLKKHE